MAHYPNKSFYVNYTIVVDESLKQYSNSLAGNSSPIIMTVKTQGSSGKVVGRFLVQTNKHTDEEGALDQHHKWTDLYLVCNYKYTDIVSLLKLLASSSNCRLTNWEQNEWDTVILIIIMIIVHDFTQILHYLYVLLVSTQRLVKWFTDEYTCRYLWYACYRPYWLK